MEEAIIQRLLQLAHGLNHARFEESVEILEAEYLFFERIESAQCLQMLFGKRGQIGVGKDFDQRDFKRR